MSVDYADIPEMTSDTSQTATNSDQTQAELDVDEFTTDDLEVLRTRINSELERRNHEPDLEAAESTELVNGQFVEWSALSVHPNLKAVKPWIQQVTDTHEQYGVTGTWLDKQQIGGSHHMCVEPLSEGDIIKVSGASHSNKKHRYYRVIALTETKLYYDPEFGLDEATVIEEVA